MKYNRLKSQKGGSAVEFAIILPFLVLLITGMIEFGLLLYDKAVITNASREGARAAIAGACPGSPPPLRKDDSYIRQIVNNYCLNRLITFNSAPNPLNIVVQPPDGSRGCGFGFGGDLTVTVSYTYNFMAPAILGFGSTKTITAKTVMKMESN